MMMMMMMIQKMLLKRQWKFLKKDVKKCHNQLGWLLQQEIKIITTIKDSYKIRPEIIAVVILKFVVCDFVMQ